LINLLSHFLAEKFFRRMNPFTKQFHYQEPFSQTSDCMRRFHRPVEARKRIWCWTFAHPTVFNSASHTVACKRGEKPIKDNSSRSHRIRVIATRSAPELFQYAQRISLAKQNSSPGVLGLKFRRVFPKAMGAVSTRPMVPISLNQF
jgi:hypothetical protein